MNRNLLRTAMALGIATLAFSFAASVRAEDTSTPPTTTAPAPVKPKRHQWTGLVESIDAKAGSVIIKKDAESKTFKIGEKTRYATIDKPKDAAVTDIKIGDKVTVVYVEDNGVNMAHRIGPPDSAKKKAD